MKNKKYALQLLKEKINGERIISYVSISELSGYSEKQIRRFAKEIENKDIDSFLTHANKGKTPNNAASISELEYIKAFKKQYPNISISQFMDIYHEDIIFNPNKLEDVYKYNLKNVAILSLKTFIIITDTNPLESTGASKVKILILYVTLLLDEVY